MIKANVEVLNEAGELVKTFTAEGFYILFGGMFNSIEAEGLFQPAPSDYDKDGEIGYLLSEGEISSEELTLLIEKMVKFALKHRPEVVQTLFQKDLIEERLKELPQAQYLN